jgi:ATP-dependent DNA helicase RecG
MDCTLFVGGLPSSSKQAITADLAKGACRFVVGTHALVQPGVQLARAGMLVIDEQHRFGARQRMELQGKDPAADFLLLSATPIPQSLAQTLYGDLDIISLRTRPNALVPPRTHLVPEVKRAGMERFVLEAVKRDGSQVIYIAPRIEPDEEAEVADTETVFEALRTGVFASIRVGLLHGRMRAEEKQAAMEQFARGEISVLVATSVVEVGIDIPGARIIVVENAERFGLAQLHQLRGRVGRRGGEAFCFLLSEAGPDTPAQQRLRFFCTEHDGFALAEADLRMRGPGEVTGFRQVGWDQLKIADIVRDAGEFREVCGAVNEVLVPRTA